jgi:putative SOS response-associated peptidase YedK
MCGRFTQKYTWEELHRLYRLTQPARNVRPQYNICPTDPVDAIVPDNDGGLVVGPMRWQLIPPWWKKPLKDLPATFNARAETVAEKPMFRDAFKHTRCVIPASGYYEWETTPDGKQPYYITSADESVLTIAGLWSEWRDRVNDETLTTCTMIITEANSFISAIHDRMPVLLDRESADAWLSDSAGLELLKPAREDALRMWPVSRRLSKPGNGDDPSLIEPVTVHTSTKPVMLSRLN